MKCKRCGNEVGRYPTRQLCNRCYHKEYYEAHKREAFKYSRNWSRTHKEQCHQSGKKYYQRNKEKMKDAANSWHKENPIIAKQNHRSWYLRNFKKQQIGHHKYHQTKTGKEVINRSIAKRQRNMGWIKLMDNPFPLEITVDWHHLNGMFVVPVPRRLHEKVGGTTKTHKQVVNIIMERLGFNYEWIIIEQK